MILIEGAIDYNVTMNADYSWSFIHDTVLFHLKHILTFWPQMVSS